MFDELKDAFEALIPRTEMGESTADIIRIRPETVDSSEAAVGLAINAMLGSVAQRSERVESITRSSNTLLSPSVEINADDEIYRDMVAGNQMQLGVKEDTDRIVAANDAMAKSLVNDQVVSNVRSLPGQGNRSRSQSEEDDRRAREAAARAALDKLAA